MIAAGVVVPAAGLAMSGIAHAIKTLYGVAGEINAFLDKHVDDMKNSDKPTVARTGNVLEAAKYGFGIGYTVPIAIIATGQLLLGNTLAAGATVATTLALSNPIAMTCAAVGAIYYGWDALSEAERQAILDKLSSGLAVGIEMVKSIIGFVIRKTKELLSSEQIAELKKFISDGAHEFGRTLSDITKKVSDIIGDAFTTTKVAVGGAINTASDAADSVLKSAGVAAKKTKDAAGEALHTASDAAGQAINTVIEKVKKSDPKE